ncbi:hypothetical protein BKA64DRAFT_655115 [Cadophora sp. MPI-SDFR-AT-0126]|nr:hypothetical protein BKA64DRAFT_655115 [Leotiomycetes sp. MPI-SDFR-AT-0126]
MADVAEKVEALERRLDKLSNVFDQILTTKLPKRRHSVRTKASSGRPEWVKEIVRHFDEISAELKSVKKTLDTRSSADTGTSQSEALATNAEAAPEAELQYEAPPQLQCAEQVPPAIPENVQQQSVANNAPKPVGFPSPTSPPGQNITTKVSPPQAHRVPVSCVAPLTPASSNESLRRTTQPNDAFLDLRSEEGNAPTFHCNHEDISGNLNEGMLERFSSDPRVKKKGFFKITVGDLPPLNVKEASFVQPGKHHCTNFSCQSDSQGFVRLKKEQNREIVFPSFPLPESQKESWSREELRHFWEATLRKLPQDMSYVIGDPLFPDIELSPGEGLKRIDGYENLSGIGTTYAYLSGGVCFSIMHKEDAEFLSLNLLRSGGHKLWLLVEPAYGKELERHMRQEFPEMATCSQAVRHLSRAILPSKLDEWKIPYSLIYTKPGEGVVTMRGTYHQVLNEGDGNYAIAINLLPSSLPTIPKGYKFCQKTCDPHAITAAHLRLRGEGGPLVEVEANTRTNVPQDTVTVEQPSNNSSKRKAIPAEVKANKRTRLPRDTVTVEQPSNNSSKKKAIPAESHSATPLVPPQICSLLTAVCGKEAFHHLCSLIYSWRDRSKPFLKIDDDGTPGVQLVQAIGALEKRSHLAVFLDRFFKVKLAEEIDGKKDGRVQADPVAITKLINGLGWEDDGRNRKKVHRYLNEGRRWKKICGSFDGLLCLIPPNLENGGNPHASGSTFRELSGNDIELFHSLLKANKFRQPLCRVGKIFQASILSDAEVPEFKWEGEDPKDISRMSMKELDLFMEKFHVITENEYEPAGYDWPKPDGWLWDWPRHPMWVPPSDERQCELCHLCTKEKICDCISTCLPKNKPRITNEGRKGQGVRAIGLTYLKDQILGEFCGEVVPLDTHKDGWPMEFIRPDLNDEPVAQIYPRERGNWVRKVNHSCDPTAEFRVMKISGWWRQMLVATREIPHNCEITASCGRSFLKGQGKECLCDGCSGCSTHQ